MHQVQSSSGQEKRERDEQKLKRKNAEEIFEGLKRKRKSLQDVCESFRKDADDLTEQAEGSTGTKMTT